MNVWCEHCRDHYPTSHYIEDAAGIECHGVGPGFGKYGRPVTDYSELASTLRTYTAPVCGDCGDVDCGGPRLLCSCDCHDHTLLRAAAAAIEAQAAQLAVARTSAEQALQRIQAGVGRPDGVAAMYLMQLLEAVT